MSVAEELARNAYQPTVFSRHQRYL